MVRQAALPNSRDGEQMAIDAGFDVHLAKPGDARALHGGLAQLEQLARRLDAPRSRNPTEA